MARETESEEKALFLTAGETFSDGFATELLRTPSDPEKLSLLSWNGQTLEIGSRVRYGDREYATVDIEPSISRALRFPARVAPKETTRELFQATERLLAHFLHQPEPSITKQVFSVFASWLSDHLAMAPLLWIVAPIGSPKSIALQLLSLICRRALNLVGVTRRDLHSLPMSLGLTLLLDEPDLHPAMERLLHSSSRRKAYVPIGRRVVDLYGSKVIFTQQLPRVTVLEGDALRDVLIPTTGQLTPLDGKLAEQIAQEFQARFLGYRLRNFAKMRLPGFDVSRLTLPTQELAQALGAAIVGDEELQEKILPPLQEQDEEFRAQRARTTDAVVIEALLFFSHQNEVRKVRAAQLAEKVVEIHSGRGCNEEMSAESVGWKLKNLGIPSGRLDSAGNGVRLTDSIRRLVHELAFRYEVRAVHVGPRAGCRYCEELQKSAGSRQGRALDGGSSPNGGTCSTRAT